MPYFRFLPFSILGGVGWVFLMTTLGYHLGHFTIVKQNFDKVVLLIILISLLPTLTEALRARKRR